MYHVSWSNLCQYGSHLVSVPLMLRPAPLIAGFQWQIVLHKCLRRCQWCCQTEACAPGSPGKMALSLQQYLHYEQEHVNVQLLATPP